MLKAHRVAPWGLFLWNIVEECQWYPSSESDWRGFKLRGQPDFFFLSMAFSAPTLPCPVLVLFTMSHSVLFFPNVVTGMIDHECHIPCQLPIKAALAVQKKVVKTGSIFMGRGRFMGRGSAGASWRCMGGGSARARLRGMSSKGGQRSLFFMKTIYWYYIPFKVTRNIK